MSEVPGLFVNPDGDGYDQKTASDAQRQNVIALVGIDPLIGLRTEEKNDEYRCIGKQTLRLRRTHGEN